MKKIISLITLVAIGYGLLSYHFILFDNRLKILKKTDLKIENTFVDARGSKQLKLLLKPDLVEAGVNEILSQTTQKMKK